MAALRASVQSVISLGREGGRVSTGGGGSCPPAPPATPMLFKDWFFFFDERDSRVLGLEVKKYLFPTKKKKKKKSNSILIL